jgi:hypothetical protein
MLQKCTSRQLPLFKHEQQRAQGYNHNNHPIACASRYHLKQHTMLLGIFGEKDTVHDYMHSEQTNTFAVLIQPDK